MRSVFSFGPLLVLAIGLSACSSGSQVTAPLQAPQNTQSSSSSLVLPQAEKQVMDADVPHDGKHIFYPRVGEQNRAAHAASTSNNLNYYGGLVMNVPHIYVVYWHWTIDPNGEAAYLDNFLGGVGGSSWLNTVTQYYSNAKGYISNPTGILAGTWNDSASIPSHPRDSQIYTEAVRVGNHFGLSGSTGPSGSNVMVIVATPHGNSTRGFGTQWCAYHSSVNTNSGSFAYTNLPYQTDAGASCGEDFVNPAPAGTLDGVSVVSGHESAEAITDPYPNTGWLDNSGSEIGDKCAWSSSSGDITLSTGKFAVQPLWSNAISGCAM